MFINYVFSTIIFNFLSEAKNETQKSYLLVNVPDLQDLIIFSITYIFRPNCFVAQGLIGNWYKLSRLAKGLIGICYDLNSAYVTLDPKHS